MESWDVRSGGGVGDHLVTGCQQVLWMYLVPCLSLCIRYSRSSLHPAGAPGHGRASPRALAGPMHVCVLLPRYRDGGSQGDIPRLPHTPHPHPQRPSWNRSTAGCALAPKLMGRLLSAALGPRSSGERNFLRHFTSALLAGSRLRSWYDSHG